MAEEAITDTVDAELEALFAAEKDENAAPAADAGKPGDKVAPTASSEPPEPPKEENPVLAALEAIEEEPVKPEVPATGVSEDQKAVLEVIPTVEAAQGILQVAQSYNNFAGALEQGRFDDVESMLAQWNPAVLENWLEHFYKKHVASGEWVDRYIQENDPEAPKDSKALRDLQKRFQALESSLEEKKTVNAKAQEQDAVTANFRKYNTQVHEMFEKIGMNAADRKWITADLNQRIAADPKLMASVQKGELKGITPVFKAACREYLTRDKEVATGVAAKVAVQEQKKAPLGGPAGVGVDEIPEDIEKVKPEDRDKWQDRAFARLFGKK